MVKYSVVALLVLIGTPVWSAVHAGPVKKVVVFDIGGVLATYSENQAGFSVFKDAIKHSGLLRMLQYACSQGSGIKKRLRALVDSVLDEVGKKYTVYGDVPIIYSDKGKAYPRGFCLLHAGIISSQQLLCGATEVLCTWWNQDKCLCKKRRRLRSRAEHELVWNTINMMCDGDRLATIFTPCQEGIDILRKACATPGAAVMVFSNYPLDQFQSLLHQPFMQQALEGVPVEYIWCSGRIMPANARYGLPERRLAPKPSASAFAELVLFCCDTWGIKPEDIIFIDNQAENVRAARAQGIDGLLVNSVTEQDDIYACSFAELNKLVTSRLQSVALNRACLLA